MEAEHLAILAKGELKACQDMADRMKLAMKIVDAEHLLGGERIVFYFLSESRIDFRDLVKTLARELHTRIELRQIGSRDEARIIGDYESCGLECCCRSFLKILAPVNMRMAKVQKATLDPSKISGHCGRLKCCLRYEDETYKVLKKRLPPKNTLVETPNGKGRIVNTQILTQMVSVRYEDNKIEAMPLDEIKIIREDRSQNKNQQKQKPAGEDNKNKKQDSRPPRRQRNQRPKNQQNLKQENKGGQQNPKPANKGEQAKPKPETKSDRQDSRPVSNNNQPESKAADKGGQPDPKPVIQNDPPKPQTDQEPTKKEE
jgi:cell fate regulator YaaT (PSP1 superfamily)